jgi:hypothetical protein
MWHTSYIGERICPEKRSSNPRSVLAMKSAAACRAAAVGEAEEKDDATLRLKR